MLSGVLLLFAPFVLAQNTATISGTVSDIVGAVIPGAKVTLTNESSNAVRTTKSNETGLFSFAAVQPGATYSIQVAKEGFETWKVTGVDVHPGDSLGMDKIHLKPGVVTASIVVTAEAAGVAPTTPEVSSLITADDLKRISTTGRDVTELVSTLPGFAMMADSTNSAINYQTVGFGAVTQNPSGLSSYGANGAPPQAGFVNVSTDGANLTDPGDMSSQMANLNMDQVQEVKVQTSNFGADEAKGPVVINAVGKSGGDSYHGGLYFHIRNAAANSNDWASNYLGTPRPESRYFYPGGTIGGPVRIPGTHFNQSKHMTFFFGAEYYGQIQSALLATAFVPTPAMLGKDPSEPGISDFSEGSLERALNVPGGSFAGTGCPNDSQQSAAFTNLGAVCNVPKGVDTKGNTINDGKILTADMDAGTATYISFFPKINRTPRPIPKTNLATDAINYAQNIMATHNGLQLHARVDENISDSFKLYVTGNYEEVNDESPLSNVFYNPAGTVPGPSQQYTNGVSEYFTVNLTKTINASTTNELVLSGLKFNLPEQFSNKAAMQDTGTAWAAAGYSGGALKDGVTQLPRTYTFETPGLPSLSFGYVPPNGKGQFYTNTVFSFTDNLTKQFRTHTIKAGFYASNTTDNEFYLPSFYNGNIVFDRYDSCQIDIPKSDSAFPGFGAGKNPTTTEFENEIPNYLSGCPSNFQQDNEANSADEYFRDYEGYATDEWKTTSKLTLTVGARFSHFGPWNDMHGNGALVYLPNALTPHTIYPFTGGESTWTNFSYHGKDSSVPVSGYGSKALWVSPRVGLAYDFYGDGKTVLRGGWGAYRSHDPAQTVPIIMADGQWTGQETGLLGGCTYTHLFNPNVLLPDSQTGESCPFGVGSPADPSNPEARADIGLPGAALREGDHDLPVTYNYNFTVDQVLPKGITMELAYVGNQASHLIYDRNVNVIPLGAFFNPNPLTGQLAAATAVGNGAGQFDDYRPYPNFNAIPVLEHTAWANYNALQASLNRYKGSLVYGVNYTWGKALGTPTGYWSASTGLDPVDLHNDYGQLTYNRNHVINAHYSYVEGVKFRGNHMFGAVLNNWELSGITTWQSGPDLTAFAGVAYGLGGGVSYGTSTTVNGTTTTSTVGIPLSAAYYLGSSDYGLGPTVKCNPNANLASSQYVNGNCFGLPQPGTQGSWHLPYSAGPSFFKSDLSVIKNVKINDKQKLQFTLFGNNFLNHPNKAFNVGNGAANLALTVGNAPGALPTTASEALQNAVIENGASFGYAPYKSGVRVMEASVKYSF